MKNLYVAQHERTFLRERLKNPKAVRKTQVSAVIPSLRGISIRPIHENAAKSEMSRKLDMTDRILKTLSNAYKFVSKPRNFDNPSRARV